MNKEYPIVIGAVGKEYVEWYKNQCMIKVSNSNVVYNNCNTKEKAFEIAEKYIDGFYTFGDQY